MLLPYKAMFYEEKYIDESSLAYNFARSIVSAAIKQIAEMVLLLYPQSKKMSIFYLFFVPS
jgi:hypothetical protein